MTNIRKQSFPANKRHGEANKSKEYKTWCHIKARCLNRADYKYPDYGGRGIKVCDAWINSFESFLTDMGRAPTRQHSIDRIDNNGDYSPENCKWSTPKEQANNTRRNVMIQYRGDKKSLPYWCQELGLSYKTVWYRLKLGWTVDRAFNCPLFNRGQKRT